MRKFPTTLCAAIALSFGLGSATPVLAAPVSVPAAPMTVSSDIVQVQSNGTTYRRDGRGNDRRDRFQRHEDRRDRIERRGNHTYYRGHRGHREHRPGFRYHEGFWFPSAAFVGAILGNAISGNTMTVRPAPSRAHVAWCSDRWRSYRASDNSYQPYTGPRRTCVSPYS